MNGSIVRKISLILMVSALLCSGIAMSDEISPRYAYTDYIDASLEFSNGRAISIGSIFAYGMRATSVEVRLQQYFENDWRTIGLWTGSSSGGTSEAGGSEEIDTGFEYRTYTRGKVYDSNGNVLETVNFYSDVKYY